MKTSKEKNSEKGAIDEKTGRKKVVAKPIPAKQGHHGTDPEKKLNPEE